MLWPSPLYLLVIKNNKKLYYSWESFHLQQDTACQIQMLLAPLEDAKYKNQENCVAYIDFCNAFRSFDHARLLAIMEDLGFPLDAI